MAGKHFIEQGSDLIVDAVGNKIPAKTVIFCKKRPFIITKGGDINTFTGEEMDVIYQAADEDPSFSEAQVKELDAERSQSIVTSILEHLHVLGTKLQEGKLPVSPNTDNFKCSKPCHCPKCGSNPRHACDHNKPGSGSSGGSPPYLCNGRTGIVCTRNCLASDNNQ